MNFRFGATWVAVFSLAGCATPHVSPHEAVPPETPKASTAILIAIEQRNSPDQRYTPASLPVVKGLDGKALNCDWNAGCPVWIRVLPGDHQFEIFYRADFNYVGSAWNEATIKLDVPKMRAGHVYVARYSLDRTNKTVSARVEDLGEKPNFGLWYPFLGVQNARQITAEF